MASGMGGISKILNCKECGRTYTNDTNDHPFGICSPCSIHVCAMPGFDPNTDRCPACAAVTVEKPPELKVFKITICKRSDGVGHQYESILILATDMDSAETEAWDCLGYDVTTWTDNTWTTTELTGPFNSGYVLATWVGR